MNGGSKLRALLVSYVIVALVAAGLGGGIGGYVVARRTARAPWQEPQQGLGAGTPGQGETGAGAAGEHALPQAGAQGALGAEEAVVVRVAREVGPAVVKVSTVTERETYNFFFERMIQRQQGLGSGVIFDPAGYILTNRHVVKDATQIKVVLTDGREFPATVVGHDYFTDLAVLKITGDNLPAAKLGDSDKLQVGQTAVAIGNPYGFDHTVTTGVISALNRSLPIDEASGVYLENLIQTDAPINPGNSGGALLDSQGYVVGINTAIVQEAQNIGFAIPVNRARAVAKELIDHGKVRRPWFGAQLWPVEPDEARQYGLPARKGLAIVGLMRGSPADKAGLQGGDIITAVDGQEIEDVAQLRKDIERAGIGGKVQMTIARDGRTFKVDVTVGEMP